jgi:hypothetical protein
MLWSFIHVVAVLKHMVLTVFLCFTQSLGTVIVAGFLSNFTQVAVLNRNVKKAETCTDFNSHSCVCVRRPICCLSMSVWIVSICPPDVTLNVKADVCQLLLDSRECLKLWILIKDYKCSDHIVSYVHQYRLNVLWQILVQVCLFREKIGFHRRLGVGERAFASQTCCCKH